MSQSNTCPRCGQAVKLGTKYGQIKPHRDELSRANCPTEGMTLPEAADWVERARAQIKAMAR